MKIYVTHSGNFNFKEDLYEPLRNSELNTLYEITLPHEQIGDVISSKELILTQDLILAEVSYPSTGQGIELGWADANRVPILCVYKAGHTYSQSLKVVTDNFIEYKNADDLVESIKSFIQRQ